MKLNACFLIGYVYGNIMVIEGRECNTGDSSNCGNREDFVGENFFIY